MDADELSQVEHNVLNHPPASPAKQSPIRSAAPRLPEKTFQVPKDDETLHASAGQTTASASPQREVKKPVEHTPVLSSDPISHHTPELPSSPAKSHPKVIPEEEPEETQPEEPSPTRSQLDGSSPIRPAVVRKSSLNFASLPAREPLTASKSRASRTSHLEHHRMSQYSRHTGGKSLGTFAKQDASDDEDQDDEIEVDVDDFPAIPTQETHGTQDIAVNHNKAYTQTLQDRINMLGKSQLNGNRTSKSLHSITSHQQAAAAASQTAEQEPKSPSPKKTETTAATPGAFPKDDDDDWIDPPPVEPAMSQRPSLPKSNSTGIVEGIHAQASAADDSNEREDKADSQSQRALNKSQRPSILAHNKSASVSAIPTMSTAQLDGSPLKKTISTSNLSMVNAEASGTPAKSPSRAFRDSPLKQVKNKLSSILKGSKNLLASSAAISAEGKSSIISPSTTRPGTFAGASELALAKESVDTQHMELDSPTAQRQASPTRAVAKRTRASVEREKEEKRRQAKEAAVMAEQMVKLEKERAKEREKVRVFSKEQEKLAAMEKQLASKKEIDTAVPKETPKPNRSSPRKAKVQPQTAHKTIDNDIDMMDASASHPPPSATRSIVRGKELRRPIKPGKETHAKAKPTPTVIRVNTGSQHSQFHPASSTMSSSFQDTSTQSQQQLGSKASKATLGPKPSAQSLKSSVSSVGRPKALDIAAKKKEQDEREAQRRREAKADFERKRAAAQDEQRKQEQQRRQEAERQKQKEREQAEAKKSTQRQAAIEKAKQTRAPPPAVRSQPNGPVDFSLDKPEAQPARPPSRMNSGIFRSQEDGRPVNAVLSTASKAAGKRPLGQDSEAGSSRHAPSYGGPHYQAKDAKRRRTSDFTDELDMDQPPNIKGPPVRPSGGFKKVCSSLREDEMGANANDNQDMAAKSIFHNGYTNVPQSATRDLFKATVTSQHTGQTKAAHPLDMAQISKGAIPFAPNPPAGQAYKTPARPGAMSAMSAVKSVAKSAQRSSPRFQNGESIELPEIHSDEDDEDDEGNHGIIAPWADSPDLRRALMQQEMMDPAAIFGPPAPLNMDEVFSKYMDKGRKFRKRTSSANWSGIDRLTEEDIRKDLAARDKLRRDGGWSYELSRDVM